MFDQKSPYLRVKTNQTEGGAQSWGLQNGYCFLFHVLREKFEHEVIVGRLDLREC